MVFYLFYYTHRYLQNMTRSLKGPYVDPRVLKKISKPNEYTVDQDLVTSMCDFSRNGWIYLQGSNGRKHIDVLVSEDMIGHRLGNLLRLEHSTDTEENMKELDQKRREAEIQVAKAARANA